MKRIYFDSKGVTEKHSFFWKPWGCLGCAGRGLFFLLLLFVFLYLLAQLRSCRQLEEEATAPLVYVTTPGVPPIDEDDIIDDGARRIVANRLNVLFDAEVGERKMEIWTYLVDSIWPGGECRVLFSDVNTKLMALEVPPQMRDSIKETIVAKITNIPFLVFDEEVMGVGDADADPFLSNPDCWYTAPIELGLAHSRTYGSTNVTVAVVDSYFDLSNPELEGLAVVSPYNVADGGSDVSLPADFSTSNPDAEACHGTMVASLAVGRAGNGYGSAGVAPYCSFMPVSLGRRFGCFAMLQGILYAINHGASVINVSAGLSFAENMPRMTIDEQIAFANTELKDQEAVWKYVFDMADKYYVTIVWAAGNEDLFLALDASKRGPKTIKVSAVDKYLHKASFSNWGDAPSRGIYESTISAPGVALYGERPNGCAPTRVDGTSFAAPLVAGAVGLVKSIDPTLPTQQIAGILQATGVRVGTNISIGPILQIAQALDSVYATIAPYEVAEKLFVGGATYPSSHATTFLRYEPDSLTESEHALPPLISMELVFESDTTAVARFISNLAPDQAREIPLHMSRGEGVLSMDMGGDADDLPPVVDDCRSLTITKDEAGRACLSFVGQSLAGYWFYMKK